MSLSDDIFSQYFQALQFSWPYENRDVYRVNPKTKKHAFSNEFDCVYHNLRNWELRLGDDNQSQRPGQMVWPAVDAMTTQSKRSSKPSTPLSMADEVTGINELYHGTVPTKAKTPCWFTSYEVDILAAIGS